MQRDGKHVKSSAVSRTGVSATAIALLAVLLAATFAVLKYWLDGQFKADTYQFDAPSYWYIVPFGIVGLISWSVWFSRWIISRRYEPMGAGHTATTSVLVPVFREDPLVLTRCLDSWLECEPDEIILVVDLADHDVFEMLDRHYGTDRSVRVVPFKHDGKRSAMAEGVRHARHEILIFTDSDTAWEPELLGYVLAPFEDPEVGGVSTRQNVYKRETSMWRVIADWQVNTRYLDYVPAESRAGGVICLSGRTAAYRRDAVVPNVPDLEEEIFMGRKCVSGDDGRLTWLVLKDGWKTVYQSNARAVSMFPNTGRAYVKQRIRWSRNSIRCYLTAIKNGWLFGTPLASQIRVFQILCTPITQFVTLFYVVWFYMNNAIALALLSFLWLFAGRIVRSVSHLREHPADIRFIPIYALVVIFVALPIKLWAFFTMNVHGWLTRTDSSRGGEGQSEESVTEDIQSRDAALRVSR